MLQVIEHISYTGQLQSDAAALTINIASLIFKDKKTNDYIFIRLDAADDLPCPEVTRPPKPSIEALTPIETLIYNLSEEFVMSVPENELEKVILLNGGIDWKSKHFKHFESEATVHVKCEVNLTEESIIVDFLDSGDNWIPHHYNLISTRTNLRKPKINIPKLNVELKVKTFRT